MRRYACPYCGERSLREYQKYPTRSFPCPTCSACGRRVYLSTPPVSLWFLLAPAAVCLLIVLSALTPWKWLMIPWLFLIWPSCFLGSYLRADLPDEAWELTVLVEPSAAEDGEVRLAFLDPTKGRDFSGVDFWLKDGNERICIGRLL